jgi:NitT/TauT family transport system substrate-binding protein
VILEKKIVSTFLLPLILIFIPAISKADTTTPVLACSQPASAPSDAGTLILAAQNQQLTSTEWGIRQGCFKKYGLTIKTASITSSTIGIAGVISGSYDLTATSPVNLIQAKINGGFAGKIIAPKHGYSAEELSRAKREPYFPGELLLQTAVIVRANSDIKSWKDLDKRKIAVQTFQSADHAGVLLGMRSDGIRNPKSEFLVMPPSQMVDALKRGDVDAVIGNDPFATQMVLDGGRIIGYPQSFFAEPGSAVVFLSSTETSNKKAREMRIFRKATLEINSLLNKPENEASFRKVVVDVTKVSVEVASKNRIPLMMEKSVTISEIAYIPSKLKKVGFLKGRFDLGPLLFN